MLFLHGFHPYYINAININWFMANLAVFYVVSPMLFRLINSLEKAIIALFIVVPAGFIIKSVTINLNIVEVHSIWDDYVNILSFPSEFPIMLLGIMAYHLYKKLKQDDLIRHKKLFSIACLISIIIPLYSLFIHKEYFIIYNNIFSFGVISMLVLISQLIYPVRLIKNPVFSVFGKHSYGIYLSHIFVLRFLNTLGISGGMKGFLIGFLGLL